jgi:hypothetical protein
MKKIIQQQELMDAKINSIAQGHKMILDEVETSFKRMRSILFSIESSQEEMLKEINEKVERLNEELKESKKDTHNFENQPSTLIADKMKFEVSDLFVEDVKSEEPIHPFVSVHLPKQVISYLMNRSKEFKKGRVLRSIFERNGNLVYYPLSHEVVKNFTNSETERLTIYVSEPTYRKIIAISNNLDINVTAVASNLIANLDEGLAKKLEQQVKEMSKVKDISELPTRVEKIRRTKK